MTRIEEIDPRFKDLLEKILNQTGGNGFYAEQAQLILAFINYPDDFIGLAEVKQALVIFSNERFEILRILSTQDNDLLNQGAKELLDFLNDTERERERERDDSSKGDLSPPERGNSS